ncbi:tyrosine-type recombinase/integrase [Sinorhizobium meliloti]|uniref:tyrosine-type recombinase/integrase n=1 Tax=Rhizobium meliloti TaxID=382 RepID=UPI000B4A35DC|nr:tyrosine-type recombinase/integrase [Sinorhizobium meliloti]ASP69724.1 integrase [Sinorhizobium meliloti]MQX00513.1 tyrosine-type recombinase/integrase [Sinorhizobium meliloti]RVH98631.1 integrase [Sinorhizobium meliloti]RVK38598.1 integrase [Sinorhizobium meliloti]RVO19591.1 integrase [Sinorhizobium meliloti]
MLSQLLADHAALHQALGFKFRTPGVLLRNFVAFAEHRGEHVITTATVHEWALQAPSPEQRRNRLLTVRRFALSLHAEDPRHEVPSADLFGRASRKRRTPYIYSPEEIRRLIDAARRLGPDDSIRSLTYATMFGLIAATGMRVSEAIAIRLHDVTDDGLIIAQTKFKKSRLLPLHTTTRRALDGYLATRLKAASQSDALFISHQGTPLAYPTVITVFLQIIRSIGLRGAPGSRGPRIHDLRHTFAVRSLERCAHDSQAVARHITALSTYLGHAHVTDTYWYLQSTPELMAHMSEAGETLHRGVTA